MTIKASGALEKIYSIEAGEVLFGTFVLHFWDTGSGARLLPQPGHFVIHPEHQEHFYELPNHVSVHETLFVLSGAPSGRRRRPGGGVRPRRAAQQRPAGRDVRDVRVLPIARAHGSRRRRGLRSGASCDRRLECERTGSRALVRHLAGAGRLRDDDRSCQSARQLQSCRPCRERRYAARARYARRFFADSRARAGAIGGVLLYVCLCERRPCRSGTRVRSCPRCERRARAHQRLFCARPGPNDVDDAPTTSSTAACSGRRPTCCARSCERKPAGAS